MREKGTNRSQFLRGQVDKYTWVDLGSSYLPSELLSALLLSQFERFDFIQQRRHWVWDMYARALATWAEATGVRLMWVPEGAEHAAHLFYLLLPTADDQTRLIQHLALRGIVAAFHYQPLDRSPAGQRLGHTPVPCTTTADCSARLVRLPLHPALSDEDVHRVIEGVTAFEVHQ